MHAAHATADLAERGWSVEPGQELVPGFRAMALLGDGRRCETWLAWDVARWCAVAVKLPRPSELGAGKAEAALARERQVVAGLSHPGLRRLLDSRLWASPPHLIFEYLEGPTLDQALDEDGPFDPIDVLLVGTQLAGTLAYLHERGLVHLDLKPGNAVLRDGRAILMDLGIALGIGTPPERGQVRGSPPYMAPEQLRREAAAPGMDLFALGAVLYELATGEPAYRTSSTGPPGRQTPQLLGRPELRPAERNPEVPEALDEVIWYLLAPEPGGRPPTARAALAELAGALPADLAAEDRPWPGWATELLKPNCSKGET
jgi:serine/threonine protein kinase